VEAVLAWSVFVPSPHPGGDNAGYVALAHSLLSGNGYTEIWDPAAPPHTKYPPVFPLLLAAAMALGARGWTALKLVPVLATLAATAGMFLWARRRVGEGPAAAVAFLAGLTPAVLYHSHWLLSDVPFLALTVLALWRLDAVLEEGEEGRGGHAGAAWRAPVLAALLTALAYFTRSAGLPLVVAALGAAALRRRWRALSVVAGVVAVPALLWAARGRAAGPGEGDYGSEFLLLDPYRPDLGGAGPGDLASRFLDNVAGYATVHFPRTFFGDAGTLLAGLGLLLLTAALVGWVRAVRRAPGVPELFVPLYAGLVFLWPPVWSGDRFALPLVPLLLLYAAEALLDVVGRLQETLRTAILAGAVLLVAAPAGVDLMRTREEQALCRGAVEAAGPWACGGPALVDFVAAAGWARDNLPEGSVVLTRKPRIWYLASGIPTRTYPFSEMPGALGEAAASAGARWVLLDYVGSQGAVYVGGAVERDPGAFCQAALFGGGSGIPPTRMLGLVADPSEGGIVSDDGGILLPACGGAERPAVVSETASPGPGAWRIPLLEERGGAGTR